MAGGSQGRKSAERQSPEAFFNAAMKLLGEGGAERLTVNALCDRLGVTKGSFYHHFAGIEEFVVDLLRAREAMLAQVIDAVADTDPARTLEIGLNAIANAPHEAEGALRAWAHTSRTVAEAMGRVDVVVEQVNLEVMRGLGFGPDRARVLARMGATLVTGMQQRPGDVDRELLLAGCIEFLRSNLGLEVRREDTAHGRRFRVARPTGIDP